MHDDDDLILPGWFLLCPVWVLVEAGPFARESLVQVRPRRAWLEPWLLLQEALVWLFWLPRTLLDADFEPVIPLFVRAED
jgi:hypothetical protein